MRDRECMNEQEGNKGTDKRFLWLWTVETLGVVSNAQEFE